MEKVSILMNGYNAQKYLKEAIDSIYAQTFTDWEIIFVDNCSTDDTKKIVDSYDEKIKYYKTDENLPLGAARNFGLQYCKGKYLAFLDTDDIWLSYKLERQVEMMDSNFEYKLCYAGVIYIDEKGSKIGKLIPKAKSGNVFLEQLKGYEINMQSVMLRNNDTIYFNEALRHSPDFDLFVDIASEFQVCVIEDYLVKYRKLENSLTSKNIEIWWSEMKYTLDRIFSKKNDFQKKHQKEYQSAYAKVSYNKAQYLISIGKNDEASLQLLEYKFLNYKYFILYLASFFPKSIWKFIHKYK